MCSVCGAIVGHLDSCPLAEDVVVGTCEACGAAIYSGEEIWTDPMGDIYHADCFDDNIYDIIGRFEFIKGFAGEEGS